MADDTALRSAIRPSKTIRQLGRTREYGRADMPARLHDWHAPRANRWEHVQVTAGTLTIETLDADRIAVARLAAGDSRWQPPGVRWRVADLCEETAFLLAIHADDQVPASQPQPLRAAWLADVEQRRPVSADALAHLLSTMTDGSLFLVHTGFAPDEVLITALQQSAGRLYWHPLSAGNGHHTTLIVRTDQPVTLRTYLGRDHALIEAALVGALKGNTQYARWLRSTLLRHLVIEEALLFPAWLAAGGKQGWVDGLRNEHDMLRHCLDNLADRSLHRRFLLLLDGHDEKEERTVYPDIVRHLHADIDQLTRRVICTPIPRGAG